MLKSKTDVRHGRTFECNTTRFSANKGNTMEKVLLAIDGIAPDKKAVDYAVQLCKRIRAQLDVLQIIHPQKCGTQTKVVKDAKPARRYFEESMTAATFAEAGEHETAEMMMSEASKHLKQLLSESNREEIPYCLSTKAGDPKSEILNYVESHRNVVLTLCDVNAVNRYDDGRKKSSLIQEIKHALSIPLVVIRGECRHFK